MLSNLCLRGVSLSFFFFLSFSFTHFYTLLSIRFYYIIIFSNYSRCFVYYNSIHLYVFEFAYPRNNKYFMCLFICFFNIQFFCVAILLNIDNFCITLCLSFGPFFFIIFLFLFLLSLLTFHYFYFINLVFNILYFVR